MVRYNSVQSRGYLCMERICIGRTHCWSRCRCQRSGHVHGAGGKGIGVISIQGGEGVVDVDVACRVRGGPDSIFQEVCQEQASAASLPLADRQEEGLGRRRQRQ